MTLWSSRETFVRTVPTFSETCWSSTEFTFRSTAPPTIHCWDLPALKVLLCCQFFFFFFFFFFFVCSSARFVSAGIVAGLTRVGVLNQYLNAPRVLWSDSEGLNGYATCFTYAPKGSRFCYPVVRNAGVRKSTLSYWFFCTNYLPAHDAILPSILPFFFFFFACFCFVF
jgi:hypothetical protein